MTDVRAEGLKGRDRSLFTLGILIALRATDELKAHVHIARRNGLSEDETAEVRLRRLSGGEHGPQHCASSPLGHRVDRRNASHLTESNR